MPNATSVPWLFWFLTQSAIQLMKTQMSSKQIQPNAAISTVTAGLPFFREELPLTVREAAIYLGVSIQTVYLWVERKQIPHLRVMGRNIRFLRSDLEPFRATFKHEVGDGKT
jgi:excisionase family DNA binding protein